MKLLTKEILNKLPAIGTTGEMKAEDVQVIVKFFTPDASAYWFVTEYNPETGEMFGFAELFPGCGELGYFDFNEIKQLRGKLGLPVERDMYFGPATLREVMDGKRN